MARRVDHDLANGGEADGTGGGHVIDIEVEGGEVDDGPDEPGDGVSLLGDVTDRLAGEALAVRAMAVAWDGDPDGRLGRDVGYSVATMQVEIAIAVARRAIAIVTTTDDLRRTLDELGEAVSNWWHDPAVQAGVHGLTSRRYAETVALGVDGLLSETRRVAEIAVAARPADLAHLRLLARKVVDGATVVLADAEFAVRPRP